MSRVPFQYCTHPKCGARMQRLYIRDKEKKFRSVGWICPECGITLVGPLKNDLIKSIRPS